MHEMYLRENELREIHFELHEIHFELHEVNFELHENEMREINFAHEQVNPLGHYNIFSFT